MKSTSKILIVLNIVLASLWAWGFPTITGLPCKTSLTSVYVDPSNITDTTITPFENITIAVKISNVTELYGFDIQLNWNTSILNYTSHIVKIPVETYSDGILHQPVLAVKNEVNTSMGTYVLVYSSLQAPSFNGSGTVFEMTFTVLEYGECALTISNSDLSNRKGQPIEHTVTSGYFSNAYYDIAILNVVPSGLAVFIGDILNITVTVINNGTTRNENFNITVFSNSSHIDTKTVLVLPPGEEDTTVFYWNTSSLFPGNYTISANTSIVSGESNIANNQLVDGIIELTNEPINDIAIKSIIPFKTIVFEGYCFSLNITIENQGNLPETFNITIYGNHNILNETRTSLDAGYSETLVYSWEVFDAQAYETYILNATVNKVSGENDTSDNSLEYLGLSITYPGDIDSDHDVDIFDIVQIALDYGSIKGDQVYDPNSDVDCDGDVDIFDIVSIVVFYGYKE